MTLPPPRFIPLSWPYCDNPAGCYGRRVDPHTQCLTHLAPGDRAAYLAGLAPGADIDLRGTALTAADVADVMNAVRDPATNEPRLGDADFEDVTITGDARFDRATFSGGARFVNATFTGDAWFDSVTFTGDASFDSATFTGHALFDSATFTSQVWLRRVRFAGNARFGGTTFTGGARFADATFTRDARFDGARFSGDARFDNMTFAREARFDGVRFDGDARFGGAAFTGDARFDDARFSGDARFADATFTRDARFADATFTGKTWFDGARFAGEGRFESATFTREARFRGASFSGGARFGNATFGARTWFGGASFSGDAWFDHATFGANAWFDGASFSSDAWFGGARFTSEARFGGARFMSLARFGCTTFTGDAWFNDTRFGANAWFDGATLTGDARFARATFTADAWFQSATFTGEARFDNVTVHGNAWFSRATFMRAAALGPLVCADEMDLSGAVFGAPVTIEATTSAAVCLRTRWEATATLRLRYAELDLTDAVVAWPLAVATHPEPFPGTDAADALLLADRPETVQVTSLRGVDAAFLTLTDTDLTGCRFAGAFHLDQIHLTGRTVFAQPPAHRRPFRPMRWTRRRTLAEEHAWRALRQPPADPAAPSERDWTPGPDHPSPTLTPGPDDVAPVYRALRKAFEDAKNEPGAADFYYGEMEMRRHDRVDTAQGERGILTAYWALSGYGLRASRALAWLAGAISVTVLALMLWGLPTADPKPVTAGPQVAAGQHVRLVTDTPDATLTTAYRDRLTAKRAEKAGRVVLNSVVFRSSGQNLTTAGTYTEMLSRFFEPVLLALAVLAVRGRVKR